MGSALPKKNLRSPPYNLPAFSLLLAFSLTPSKMVLPAFSLLLAFSLTPSVASSPWPPTFRQQAEAIVANLSLTDLFNLTAAMQMSPYQGTIPAQPQNGLPHLGNHDGPQGVAGGFTRVTAFPSANSIANTWDPALAAAFGAANGAEHKIKGANVLLAPGVNIARIPMCGRLFEYLGEDPFLAAQMAVAIVGGIQSNNISAVVKHFILNVQETERHSVSSNVGRRTFMELYTPTFEAAVAVSPRLARTRKTPRAHIFTTPKPFTPHPPLPPGVNRRGWAP